MDDLVSRYLSKIGVCAEDQQYFSTAIFKDYVHLKESRIFKSGVMLEKILPYGVYKRLFEAQKSFAANGGFISALTFLYRRITDSDIEKLADEFVEQNNLYDLCDFYIKDKHVYFNYTEEAADKSAGIANFSTFLKEIGCEYQAIGYTKIESEEEQTEGDLSSESEAVSEGDEEPTSLDERYRDHYAAAAAQASQKALKAREEQRKRLADEREFTKIKLCDFNSFERVEIQGKIFKIDLREGRVYNSLSIFVFDGTSSVEAVLLIKISNDNGRTAELMNKYKVGMNVLLRGKRECYNERVTLRIAGTVHILPDDEPLVDLEETKRVELHVHTKMSAMDGVSEITDYLQLAKSLGHTALGLVDHGGVQSFPAAQELAKKLDIKMLYGAELYVVDEHLENVFNPADQVLSAAEYVIFDLETTGLSARYDRIIEFGAVRMKEGIVEDEIDFFVKPDMELSEVTTNLTGITSEMVRGGKSIRAALEQIVELVKGTILVSHNAAFDVGFINEALKNNGLPPLDNPVIDTLPLSRYLFPKQRSHTLGAVARSLDVEYDEGSAHRAIYDAQVLKDVFEGMLSTLSANNLGLRHADLADLTSEEVIFNARPFHITAYAKNAAGLKDLFQLISISNTDYLSSVPLVPRSLLTKFRSNLLLGSACLNGEVFQAAMTRAKEIVQKKMEYYDFIEVQPPACYSFLINDGQISHEEHLEKIIKDLIQAAEELGKTVVATGDVHYLRPEQKEFRDVYIFSKGLKGARHPLNPYRRDQGKEYPNPDQHYLTTSEMKEAFSFLRDDEMVQRIVVDNTNLVASRIDTVFPIKDKLYTPTIDNCAENLEEMVYSTAHEMYGDPLPAEVKDRLEAELKGIRENNYYVIYYIASQLVTRTNKAGYLVGSRGSVGSSLIATMAKITEVNALAPHYRCPKCHYLEWGDVNLYRSGFDLPHKTCPHCGEELIRDGQNIPFATFLGFNAEKVPDIDLNFPSNFQQQAHEMTKDLLGSGNVFKAGTIETIADKTAIGYAKGYFEHKNLDPEAVSHAEIIRLAEGCKDVKKTTGQHPGGIIVIPRDMSVYDFTPIQYPANSTDANWKTTHFDFHAIHDNVLKLDLLGHVDPYALKMMSDMTGVDIYKIPFDDPKVLELFSSTRSVGYRFPLPPGAQEYEQKVGSLGIPEFGTDFVRQMLSETKPKTFSDLLIISGLSHGTDVYNGNADEIIRSGKCTLKEVIGCRDDIMTGLHDKYGIDYSDSFNIMELVRKNNFTKPKFADKRAKYEKIMRDHGVPEYYIDSCCKIKYLFPKAHAVAYCMMGIRVGWFKVYRPLAYYATFFTVRCDQYDLQAMIGGLPTIVRRLKELDKVGKFQREAKDRSLYITMTIALEMARRGIKIEPISILRSAATTFVIDEKNNALTPPLTLIPGLGSQVAESIVAAREKMRFSSEEDLLARTKLGSSKLSEMKSLYHSICDMADLPESDQLTLF